MSTKVNFTDESLKGAIISHWGAEGVTITEQTANEMVNEVKSKMKEGTDDELKLSLSELKLDLSPTESSFKNNIITASNELISFAEDFMNKFAGWGDATRNEIEKVMGELIERARKTGNTLEQERQNIMKEKKKLTAKRKHINEQINNINNFEEDSEDSQNEIKDLLANKPELQQITQREKIWDGGPSFIWGKDSNGKRKPKSTYQLKGKTTSEVDKFNYTPEEIKTLNEAFGGGEGKKPFIVKTIDGRKKVTDRILWTRKRFAFEKALGNDDSPLYAKKLGFYQRYVALLKMQSSLISESIEDMNRIIISTRKQTNKGNIYITQVKEHGHTKSTNRSMVQDAKQKYKDEFEKYKKEVEKLGVDSAEYKRVEREMQNLIEDEDDEVAPITPNGDKLAFDPEYIYGLGTRGGKAHQQAKVPRDIWSITPDGSVVSNPLEGVDISWMYGHALYDYLDSVTDETERDANDVLKLYGKKTKVDQKYVKSPYATEEQMIDDEDREETYVNGWTREKKRRVSQSSANWAYLWNLAKHYVGKGFRPEDGHYKQIIEPNDINIRSNVIANPNTPDWVIMFMAETDSELGNRAENELGKRGYVAIKDSNKNPIPSEQFGTWVWKKKDNKNNPRRGTLQLSYREGQVNPIQPLMDQQKQLDQKQEALDLESEENQKRMQFAYNNELQKSQEALGQQPQGVQSAPDTTNAPLPPLPSPIAPMASRTWGNMFRK